MLSFNVRKDPITTFNVRMGPFLTKTGLQVGGGTSMGANPSRCAVVDAHATGRFLPAALRAHGVDWVHVVSPHPVDRLSVPHVGATEIRHGGDVARTAGRLR